MGGIGGARGVHADAGHAGSAIEGRLAKRHGLNLVEARDSDLAPQPSAPEQHRRSSTAHPRCFTYNRACTNAHTTSSASQANVHHLSMKMNGYGDERHQDQRGLQRAPETARVDGAPGHARDIDVGQHFGEEAWQIGAVDDGGERLAFGRARARRRRSLPSRRESRRSEQPVKRGLADRQRLNPPQGNRRHHPGEESELGAEIVTRPVDAEPPQPYDGPAHRQHADGEHERREPERQDRHPADGWNAAAEAAARTTWRITPRPETFSPKTKLIVGSKSPDFPQQSERRANNDETPAVDEPGQQELAQPECQDRPPLGAGRGSEAASAGAARPDRPANTRSRISSSAASGSTRMLRFGLVAAAGLDADLDDPQQAMQDVLDRIDVLNPAVGHVTFVPEDQPARDHELGGIEAVAERQRAGPSRRSRRESRAASATLASRGLPDPAPTSRTAPGTRSWRSCPPMIEDKGQRMEPAFRRHRRCLEAGGGCGERRRQRSSGPKLDARMIRAGGIEHEPAQAVRPLHRDPATHRCAARANAAR